MGQQCGSLIGFSVSSILHTDENEDDIRPVECIIWRDGMLYVKDIPSEFLIRDRLSRNYGRDDGIEELFRRIFEK